MHGTLEVIGELIEVIHKSIADVQTQINELKTHDNSDVHIRLASIERRVEELNNMHEEKDFEDVL